MAADVDRMRLQGKRYSGAQEKKLKKQKKWLRAHEPRRGLGVNVGNKNQSQDPAPLGRVRARRDRTRTPALHPHRREREKSRGTQLQTGLSFKDSLAGVRVAIIDS